MDDAGSEVSLSVKGICMPSFKVAHLQEQGQNMLLFPLDNSFHHKPEHEQSSIVDELEARAHAAGLAGKAAVFWEHGGRGYFRGPRQWQPFLRSIGVRWVMMQVNREVSWA